MPNHMEVRQETTLNHMKVRMETRLNHTRVKWKITVTYTKSSRMANDKISYEAIEKNKSKFEENNHLCPNLFPIAYFQLKCKSKYNSHSSKF